MATKVSKRAGVVLAVLLVFAAAGGRADDATARPTLRVSSAWEPDEAIALATAEAKLQEALRQWLAATRPSAAVIATPENLAILLASPDIRRTETSERKERPYGTVARVHLSVQLPPAAIDAWRAQVLDESQQQHVRLVLKIAGMLGVLALILATVYVLDVWTQGYRRRCLGTLLAAMTALILAAALTFVN